MQLREALKTGIARLEENNVPSSALSAELLLLNVLGRDRTWLYTHSDDALDSSAIEKYFALIARRAAGEPTQYILGKQEFWGLEFEVTPAVLIPRPETEHLIEVALERLGPRRHEPLRIADVGAGSGCIAVALAKEFSNAHIIATDISAAALEVARRNAALHGVAERIEFVEADLLGLPLHQSPVTSHQSQVPHESQTTRHSPRAGSSSHSFTLSEREGPLVTSHSLHDSQKLFDLIVSNPPYIPSADAPTLQREVRDHEPHVALFACETGLEIYARLIAEAEQRLPSGGALIMELGFGLSGRVRTLLEATSRWQNIAIADDLAAIPRVLSATLR